MKKNYFIQAVRGIAIICVVLIHTLIIDYGTQYNNEINIIIRTAINWSVGGFIFIAGYFINIDSAVKQKKQFYIKKIKRIIIPFLIWSTVYSVVFYGELLATHNYPLFFKYLISGKSGPQMYYILVLLQLIILTPIMGYLIKKNNRIIDLCIIIITPIYVCINGVLNIFYNRTIPLYATLGIAWSSFYYIGMKCKYNENSIKSDNKVISKTIFSIAIIWLSISCAINIFEYKSGVDYSYCASQVKLTNFIYTCIVIAVIQKLNKKFKDKMKHNFMTVIGDYSFGIFLIHMFLVSKLTNFFKSISGFGIIKSILNTVLSLAISMVVIYMVNKVTKNKAKKYLGF